MDVLTIPKNLVNKGELVIIPRREYESLLSRPAVRQVLPTRSEQAIVNRGRREIAQGKTALWALVQNELAHYFRKINFLQVDAQGPLL